MEGTTEALNHPLAEAQRTRRGEAVMSDQSRVISGIL